LVDIFYKDGESVDLLVRPVYVFGSLNYCYNNNRPMVDLGHEIVTDLKIMMPDMANDRQRIDAQIGFKVSFDLDQLGPFVKKELGIITPLMDVSRTVDGTRISVSRYDIRSDNPHLTEAFHLAYDFLNAFVYTLSKAEGIEWNYIKVGKIHDPNIIFPEKTDGGLEGLVRRKVA